MTNRRRIDPAERIAQRKARAKRAIRLLGRVLGGLLLLGSMPAAVYFGHRFLTESPLFAIREITITGLSRISEIEAIAHLPIAVGDNLFRARLAESVERLESLPWVAKAEMRFRFPQGIEFAVLERVPRALVDLGHLYLVDEGGTIFKRAIPSDPLDLPVITGLPREEWNHAAAVARRRLVSALETLEVLEKHPLVARHPIQQLQVDEADEYTVVLGERPMIVHLGQGDLTAKMDRLSRVIDEAERRGKRVDLARLDNRTRPEWVAARLSRRPGGVASAPEG